MRIEECTRTKDGTPVEIWKRFDDNSHFPWLGVFWVARDREWEPNRWADDGTSQALYTGCDNLDLDLHDWREHVPWESLPDCREMGVKIFSGKNSKMFWKWIKQIESMKGKQQSKNLSIFLYDLGCRLQMLEDKIDAIARRPEGRR